MHGADDGPRRWQRVFSLSRQECRRSAL